MDDRDLRYVHPPRRESIGARSAPYGSTRVNVYGPGGELAAPSVTETTISSAMRLPATRWWETSCCYVGSVISISARTRSCGLLNISSSAS